MLVLHTIASRKSSPKYVYQFIHENGGWENWDMIQIEAYACTNKRELHSRERYWLEKLNAKLNLRIPTQTKLEWDNKNPNYKKDYYSKNKENISTKRTKRYQNDREMLRKKISCELCGNEVCVGSMKRHQHSFHSEDRYQVPCVICVKMISRQHLQRHICEVHENTGKKSCEVCGKQMNQRNISRHMQRKHNELNQ